MSASTWQAIAVALDRLQAADVDPAPIGDLLVLVGHAHMLGVDVTRLLCASGWEPPPPVESRGGELPIDERMGAAGAFLRYTARIGAALTGERKELWVSASVHRVEPAPLEPQPAAWELPAERPRPRIVVGEGLPAQVREALEQVVAEVAAEARERWPGGESEGGEG